MTLEKSSFTARSVQQIRFNATLCSPESRCLRRYGQANNLPRMLRVARLGQLGHMEELASITVSTQYIIIIIIILLSNIILDNEIRRVTIITGMRERAA